MALDVGTGDVAGLGGRPRLPPVALRPREVVAAAGGQRLQAVRVRGGPRQGHTSSASGCSTSRSRFALDRRPGLGAEELRRRIRRRGHDARRAGALEEHPDRAPGRGRSAWPTWRRRRAEPASSSEIDETPAMPLGTVALSPLELATAYGAFAGLGEAAAPRLVLRVADEQGGEVFAAGAPQVHRLLDPGVAFLVTNVLQDAARARHGHGRARAPASPGPPRARRAPPTTRPTPGSSATRRRWWPRCGWASTSRGRSWARPRRPAGRAGLGTDDAPGHGRAARRPTGGSAPANVVQAWVDAATGVPLAAECRSDYDDALPGAVPARHASPRRAVPTTARCSRGCCDWLPDDEGEEDADEEAERWRRRREREREERAPRMGRARRADARGDGAAAPRGARGAGAPPRGVGEAGEAPAEAGGAPRGVSGRAEARVG